MSFPILRHSNTNSGDLKKFYSGSSISKAPRNLQQKPQTSHSTLPRIQITGIEHKDQLYSEVFLNVDKQFPQSKKKKQSRPRRPLKKSSDFFYQLLFVDTPTFDSSLKDLLCIAELGIPQGDIKKEANICISLGDKYYDIKKNISAIRFYKQALKDFTKTKDLEGQSTAYNRLGIVYFIRNKLIKSLRSIKKHQSICDEDFVPIYNMGIVRRALGQLKSSVKCLMTALDIASDKDNKEEICLAHAQLGLTYKAMEKFELADLTFKKAAKMAKAMKAVNLMAEIKIALAYLNYYQGRIGECKKYFYSGMFNATGHKSEICRINLGILSGEEKMRVSFDKYCKK